MKPNVLICPSDAAWKATRSGPFVGASEAAALFGLHPYMTERELWRRLQGERLEIEETEAMLAGNCLEAGIARMFEIRHAAPVGNRVLSPQEFYAAPADSRVIVRHEFAPIQCTPDAIIATESGAELLQIKNVSEWKEDAWTNGAPREYQIQVQAEMACTGMPRATLVALIGGNRLIAHRYEANHELQRRICERAKALLELGIEPMPGTDDEVRAMFPQSVEGLSKEIENPEVVYEYARLKAQMSDLEEELDRVKVALQNDIGPAETFTIAGKKAGTWKTSMRNDPPREARSYPVRTLRLDSSITKQAKQQLPQRHEFPLLSE